MLANAFTNKSDLIIKCSQNITKKWKGILYKFLKLKIATLCFQEQYQFCWSLNSRQTMIQLPETV